MKVFQYVVFYLPAEEDSVNKPTIVVEPQTLLASDEKSAMLRAARSIPSEYMDRLDDLEIAIRPF